MRWIHWLGWSNPRAPRDRSGRWNWCTQCESWEPYRDVWDTHSAHAGTWAHTISHLLLFLNFSFRQMILNQLLLLLLYGALSFLIAIPNIFNRGVYLWQKSFPTCVSFFTAHECPRHTRKNHTRSIVCASVTWILCLWCLREVLNLCLFLQFVYFIAHSIQSDVRQHCDGTYATKTISKNP